MRGLQALRNLITPNKKTRSGQSLVEMALALPVMLIMISGLIEFGFALNQYLNTLDAAREGARFVSDLDPLDRDLTGTVPGIPTNTDCATTGDFYMLAACVANRTMEPVDFFTGTDDVVISVFRVLSGTVIDRWPNCEPSLSNDCPFDPPTFPETMGEWHLFGRGNACGNGLDDDGDTFVDDGCGAIGAVGASEFCDQNTDVTCHPSRLDIATVQSKIDTTAPDSAVVLVEVFYAYPHVLQLPWITPFVPNPLPLHTYTILPLPQAEPSLTITGTVTLTDGTPVGGASINFNNGMLAITDSTSGEYVRTGLSSGWLQWQVVLTGTNCSVSTPIDYNQHLTINSLYNMDFVLSNCIDVQATAIAAATQTAAVVQATGTAGALQTEAAATADYWASATAAASSGPPTETATATASPTPDPLCSPLNVSALYSSVDSTNPNPPRVQADGSETVDVLVQLKNECDTTDNMAGRTVTLSSDRGGLEVVSPGSASADGAGQATFQVRSSSMSPWDSTSHTFTNSVLTGVGDGVTINDQANAAFMCVGGLAGTAVNGDEVVWTFQNDTGMDRRLVQLDAFWSQPEDPTHRLLDVSLGGVTIWDTTDFANPITIANTDWTSQPADRVLPSGVSKDLKLTFNFPVTGGQSFSLIARWDNTSGVSFCDSNQVDIIR
jgi:hypothetical protein